MIKRICCSFFLVELLLALSIYLIWVSAGVEVHTIDVGGSFLSFLKSCSEELNEFKIEIPNIPLIPKLDEVNGFMIVINAIVVFFNGVINVLNVLVNVINIILQLLEFIFIILKNFMGLRDMLVDA